MRMHHRGSALASGLLAGLLCATPALASSHREAPFITTLPKADGTDFYMFRSYEKGRDGFVTLIADYQGLQDPAAGPNYYPLDKQVQYEIHIDNSGKGQADLTFKFQFGEDLKEAAIGVGGKLVQVPLRNLGPITKGDNSKLNQVELYTVSVIRGPGEDDAGEQQITNNDTAGHVFVKPLDNIGQKSIPDYEGYARQYLYNINIPGCGAGRMFVGQRKDPFAVNTGELFDLVNLKDPLGPMDQGKDDLKMANVSSFVLEVPISCLAGKSQVIGGWTTASMPATRIGNQSFLPKEKQDSSASDDDYVQVSRLGMPLVNEVVIGLKDKDRFNASDPKDDAQFLDYVTNPTLPTLIEMLFADKGVKAPTAFPRKDLVQVFLTGVPGLNENGATAEMMRLNVTTPPVAAAQQSNLGVLAKDLAGFPNGRRPGDDVVDIALRVAMGALLPKEQAPSGQLPFTDGAFVSAASFDEAFPYLRAPLARSKTTK